MRKLILLGICILLSASLVNSAGEDFYNYLCYELNNSGGFCSEGNLLYPFSGNIFNFNVTINSSANIITTGDIKANSFNGSWNGSDSYLQNGTDANFGELTATGTIQAEHLKSTDDIELNGQITDGDNSFITSETGEFDYKFFTDTLFKVNYNTGFFMYVGLPISITGDIKTLADNKKFISGTGSDFEVFFDGTYGRIDATGDPIRIGDDTTNYVEISNTGDLNVTGNTTSTAYRTVNQSWGMCGNGSDWFIGYIDGVC